MIRSVTKFLRLEEKFAISTYFVVSLINIFIFKSQVGLVHSLSEMKKYLSLGDYFYGYFYLTVIVFSLVILYKDLSLIFSDYKYKNIIPTKITIKKIFVNFFNKIRLFLPLVLTLACFSQLVSNISYIKRFSSKDVLLAQLDLFFTNHLFFVDLPNIFNTEFINSFMYLSYTSLSTVLSVFLIFLFLKRKEVELRVVIFTIILSICISYPIYYFIPSPGPHYSLLRNVRTIAMPIQISEYIKKYNPSVYTQSTSDKILNFYVDSTKENTGLATSFPSMHATWGLIILYFLYKLYKWSIYVSVPWVVVMLTGGLYFGQHYFIDYIASVFITTLCVYISQKCLGEVSFT